MYVKAHVGKKLKTYLENSYSDGVVRPPKRSNLIGIVKQNLELGNEDDELPDDECVLIELPKINGLVYRQSDGKVYICNTLWRHRLSELGHDQVRSFFANNFKHAFHVFMDGFLEGQHISKPEDKRLKVKDGVVAFFNQYHIKFDELMISSMTRDWFRHNDRNERGKESPMVY